MKQTDLYLKYAEVIKMCKGTTLENTPWLMVKWQGKQSFRDHILAQLEEL